MRLEYIERFVRGGYELLVTPYYKGTQIHARVLLGIVDAGHNCLGDTVDEALARLDNYLAPFHTRTGSPSPTSGAG